MDIKTKDFPSELQAEVYLKVLQVAAPDWFCPIIKDMCRSDCVCFMEARMHKLGSISSLGSWRTYSHGCGNTMFTGERWEQNNA